MSEESYKWSPDNFLRAFVNGWVVDGREGGLIEGRLHKEGHIVMMRPSEEVLGEYELLGLVEGGEYVMSPDASTAFFDRIEEINLDKSPCPPAHARVPSRILNTRAEPHDKFLIIQKGQWIVNIEATNRHFDELEQMNNQFGFYNGQVLFNEEIAALNEVSFD